MFRTAYAQSRLWWYTSSASILPARERRAMNLRGNHILYMLSIILECGQCYVHLRLGKS